jgi:hypothetical protein
MHYRWPIWFSDDFDTKLTQGQLIDISSKAITFTYYTHEKYLFPNQKIITHFSTPVYGFSNSFAIRDFTRSSYILSICHKNNALYRITAQFEEVLTFRPGEQIGSEAEFISLLSTLSELRK